MHAQRQRRHSLLRQAACWDDWVCGHEGCEVRLDADGTHAWTTTAVGDTEGLVQVEVTHVSTNVAWAGQAHLKQHTKWYTTCT